MKRRTSIRAAWCALFALSGPLRACGSPPAAAGQPKTSTDASLMQADTATVVVPRSFPGQVYVEHDIVVAARSAGVIDSLLVNLGSPVHAGGLLAVIEHKDQEIQQSQAQVGFERARSAVLRSRELSKKGAVTTADSEQVEFDYRQAELVLRKTQRELELTRILAPVSGVVTARYARPRQLVAAGDTLFRVAETTPQLVRVRVPEPAAQLVRVGDRATAVATSGSVRVTATVVFAAPVLDPASGTREVILQTAQPRFLLGESVNVLMGSERRVAVVAPRSAIAADGYALVVEGDRTTLRPVTVGAELPGGRVEITSGLVAGERLARPGR